MTKRSAHSALAAAAVVAAVTGFSIDSASAALAAVTAAPLVATTADAAPADCNSNATAAAKAPGANYDGFDRFRDATGHPLPGWDYLFQSPG